MAVAPNSPRPACVDQKVPRRTNTGFLTDPSEGSAEKSAQAAYAAPLILLNQNRQTDLDRVRARRDRAEAAQTEAATEYVMAELATLRGAIDKAMTRDVSRQELGGLRSRIEALAAAVEDRSKSRCGSGELVVSSHYGRGVSGWMSAAPGGLVSRRPVFGSAVLPIAALLVSVGAYVAVTLLGPKPFEMVDLRVYYDSARHLFDGSSLYSFESSSSIGLPFTYPPFAAAVFAPLSWLPWTL